MVKNIFKSVLPHLIAIAIFALVASIYCKPALEGKVLQQEDNTQWKGMSHSQQAEADKTGNVPLWNNGMFGGMPGYLIMMPKLYNDVPYYFSKALSLGFPKPINFFVLACICFYILSQVLGANPYIGVLTSLTYAFSTYNPIIVSVGHDTKMMAIALLPGMIAGVFLLFNKKYLLGLITTALFVGAILTTKHYQIAYYGILIIIFSSIAFAIKTIIEKDFKHLLVVGALGIGGAILGIGSNIINLKTDSEYSARSIRGGSQLPSKKTGIVNNNGLDKDYALSYSYNLMEPFVLIVPKLYGGSSGFNEIEAADSKTIDAINQSKISPELLNELQNTGQFSYYWGGINEGTSGPVYAGILIFILAIFSLFIIKKQHSIWILSLFIFTVLLSYGKYMSGFNYWMLDHLPIYNKFRAPSMISVIQIFLINFTAVLGLIEVTKKENIYKLTPAFKKTIYVSGGLFIVVILFYFNSDFTTILNKKFAIESNGVLSGFFNELKSERQSLAFNSIIRSMLYAVILITLLWIFIKNKIEALKFNPLLIILTLISLVDLMGVNNQYLNSDKFVDKMEVSETSFSPKSVEEKIQEDKSDFRVIDMRGDRGQFNSAISSYFFNNIGGYNPAKLSLYQDLIDNQFYSNPNPNGIFNMLNTKYFVYDDQNFNENPNALGSAWFVKGVQLVKDPSAEMNALTNLNTKDSAVMNVANQESLKVINGIDSTASIKLTSKSNDALAYQTNSKNTQLAVFSEIYYDKGWKAYIDDKEAPILKANYLLRALVVPQGAHTIKFEFKPDAYYGYIKYAQICEWLTILLILLLIGTWIKEYRSKQNKI
jgi:hypothetical protein